MKGIIGRVALGYSNSKQEAANAYIKSQIDLRALKPGLKPYTATELSTMRSEFFNKITIGEHDFMKGQSSRAEIFRDHVLGQQTTVVIAANMDAIPHFDSVLGAKVTAYNNLVGGGGSSSLTGGSGGGESGSSTAASAVMNKNKMIRTTLACCNLFAYAHLVGPLIENGPTDRIGATKGLRCPSDGIVPEADFLAFEQAAGQTDITRYYYTLCQMSLTLGDETRIKNDLSAINRDVTVVTTQQDYEDLCSAKGVDPVVTVTVIALATQSGSSNGLELDTIFNMNLSNLDLVFDDHPKVNPATKNEFPLLFNVTSQADAMLTVRDYADETDDEPSAWAKIQEMRLSTLRAFQSETRHKEIVTRSSRNLSRNFFGFISDEHYGKNLGITTKPYLAPSMYISYTPGAIPNTINAIVTPQHPVLEQDETQLRKSLQSFYDRIGVGRFINLSSLVETII